MNKESDALIREALRLEEARQGDLLLDDPPITETIVQAFRGHQRWLSIFPIFLGLVYTGLAVWCGYEFFQSDTTKHQIAWSAGCVSCFIAIGLTKIFIWGEWRRQSVTREIKRLELRLCQVSEQLAKR